MIQDISPYKYNNYYYDIKPSSNDFILIYQTRNVLVKNDEPLLPLRLSDFTNIDINKCIYLFAIDDNKFFTILNYNINDINNYKIIDKEQLRYTKPKYLSFALITGFQLFNWYNKAQYCSYCQTPLIHDTKLRMLSCPNCHEMIFPRINPALIIAIINNDKILLSKYNIHHRNYKKYALIAGYCEIGETLEDTLKREVMEEVGLKVKDITYYKSQPWSFSGSLLMGFYCHLDGDDKITIEQDELSYAAWFTKEQIPQLTWCESLTNEMIMAFKGGIIY